PALLSLALWCIWRSPASWPTLLVCSAGYTLIFAVVACWVLFGGQRLRLRRSEVLRSLAGLRPQADNDAAPIKVPVTTDEVPNFVVRQGPLTNLASNHAAAD